MPPLDGRKQARTGAQKQARLAMLLDIAWKLFQEQPYDAITMALIAEEAGLAKGTPYRYVRTKEALFLDVVAHQTTLWFQEVQAAMQEEADHWTPEQVAVLLSSSLAARPAFIRLFGMVQPILEQNADAATIRDLKIVLFDGLRTTGEMLEARLPSLAPGQGMQILLRLSAFIIGLQQLATLPGADEHAVNPLQMPIPPIDFTQELRETLTALLR